MPKSVIPLESNPEIFTNFAHLLGLKYNYSFHDVYSLTDKDLLSFIPRPCPAVILLFPVTSEYEKFRDQEERAKLDRGILADDDDSVVWFKQTVKNACGLYALLNSISNLSNDDYKEDSRILQFKQNSKDLAKVSELINDLEKDYTDAATSGETDAPDANDEINLHFITFIKKNGYIYELDGNRTGAFKLGKADDTTSQDILNEDQLISRFQTYIDLADDENKLNFSLIALAPSFE